MNDKDPPSIRRYFRVLGTQCDKMCLALSALGGDLDYDPNHKHLPLQKESAGRGAGGRRKRGRGGSGRKGESRREWQRVAGLSVGIALSGFQL